MKHVFAEAPNTKKSDVPCSDAGRRSKRLALAAALPSRSCTSRVLGRASSAPCCRSPRISFSREIQSSGAVPAHVGLQLHALLRGDAAHAHGRAGV